GLIVIPPISRRRVGSWTPSSRRAPGASPCWCFGGGWAGISWLPPLSVNDRRRESTLVREWLDLVTNLSALCLKSTAARSGQPGKVRVRHFTTMKVSQTHLRLAGPALSRARRDRAGPQPPEEALAALTYRGMTGLTQASLPRKLKSSSRYS